MKALRDTRLRVISAVLIAAATAALPGISAADPSDPVCIMPPEQYCTDIEGHTFGTRLYRECVTRATAQQNGEYCNPLDWDLTAKLD